VRFILDENVIISAQTGRNDRGSPDLTCVSLLVGIVEGPHSLAVTRDIWGSYSRQVGLIPASQAVEGIGVMAVLRELFSDSERGSQFKSPPPELPELVGFQGIDEGDRAFVELAVDQDDGITLVTTDTKLMAAVNSLGLPGRYRFSVQSPQDVLPALSRG